ncbi:hypothetical protein T05_10727 [Trichinella murrelli]|uniref:Uncharacterized protein n=1 Tax=Trichinella murrelli TaxID=144512 RepID=A0A0V0T9X3_9BILA|nr:hypothetical protein T05_10727 [Trichinella murrelli]
MSSARQAVWLTTVLHAAQHCSLYHGKYHYKGMVDFGTNFHRLILLVVELAILLDLRAVVVLVFLSDIIGMFFFGPTVHLLVVDYAILLDRQIFVVLI